MKCLSLRPDWADLIAAGEKTTEFRTWSTTHRGDLLIHANKNLPKEAKGLLVSGYCIAVVNIFEFKRYKKGYDWKLKDLSSSSLSKLMVNKDYLMSTTA